MYSSSIMLERILKRAVRYTHEDTELDLRSNLIDAQQAKLIAEELILATDVRINLDLGKNIIGDVGAAAIADALKTSQSLESLWLTDNNIGDAGMAALAQVLKQGTSLRKLCVSRNPIGTVGLTLLAHALKVNKGLTSLLLNDCSINEEGAKMMAAGLKSNTTLATLSMEGNNIRDEGAMEVLKVLTEYNTSVTCLLLDDNGGVSSAILSAICNVVEANKAGTRSIRYPIDCRTVDRTSRLGPTIARLPLGLPPSAVPSAPPVITTEEQQPNVPSSESIQCSCPTSSVASHQIITRDWSEGIGPVTEFPAPIASMLSATTRSAAQPPASDGESRKQRVRLVSMTARLPIKSLAAKDSDNESSDGESPKPAAAAHAPSTLPQLTPSTGSQADSDDEDSLCSEGERRNDSHKPSAAVKKAPKRQDERDGDSSKDGKSKPPLMASVAPPPIPPPSNAACRADVESDDSAPSDEETARQPARPPTPVLAAPMRVARSDDSDDNSSSEEKPKPPRKSADSRMRSRAPPSHETRKAFFEQSAAKSTPTASRKKADDDCTSNSSSDDSDDSGNKNRCVERPRFAGKSKALLSGGKPAHHNPVRKTPDFAKSITPGVTQGSTNNAPAAPSETPRKVKFVVRNGKLVKDDSVSNLSPVVTPKQPNSPRRTIMVPSTQGSGRSERTVQSGKSLVPQASSIDKLLVPSPELASKPTGTGSFQMVNGKPVKKRRRRFDRV
jgi:Leucine Rich repeat